MKLEDVLTPTVNFKLKATGDISHSLRVFSLEDHVWVRNDLGMELPKIMALIKTDSVTYWQYVSRIVYRLIINKKPFAKVTAELIDEEGNSSQSEIGGVKLFRTYVAAEEAETVLLALRDCLLASAPPQKKTEKLAVEIAQTQEEK